MRYPHLPAVPPLAAAATATLLLCVCLLGAGCASDGAIARSKQEALLGRSLRDDARVVVLEVAEARATIVVSEFALAALRRVAGVMEVRRGAGSNEAYVLVGPEFPADNLVPALEREGFRSRVVRIVTQADLDGG